MARGQEEENLRKLIERAKGGDKRAFGRLFRICYEDIYDYITRRVGNHHEAEDLTMQVFFQGLRSVESYEERGHSPRAWLFRIAHNEVVDYFRKTRATAQIDELPEIADTLDVESEVANQEFLGALIKEVMRLPKAQAEVLILRFIEDLSVTETAEVLGKKEVTIRALQFKGIKNLRERLERQKAEGEKGEDIS